MTKRDRQLFNEERQVGSSRWETFSNRTQGPFEVMRDVTVETLKRIQAIFEQPKDSPSGKPKSDE